MFVRSPRLRLLAISIAIVLGVVLLLCADAYVRAAILWRRSTPVGGSTHSLSGHPVSRTEVLSIASSYAEHRWTATASNVRHGSDARGIDIQTPDSPGDKIEAGKWRVGPDNIGMPYKWGGFDTPKSFDTGVAAGKAAGDVYSSAKRRAGNGAVSDDAVGIDCSGFISRCWQLPHKLGTSMLPGICEALSSSDELLPGDIMDAPHGHVVLFIRWLDPAKSRALFYEAEAAPQPKVVASEHNILWLRFCGARPFRYLLIQD